MKQTLKQRIVPEVDERETEREAGKIADFFDDSMSDLMPFNDRYDVFDFDSVFDQMDELEDMTEEISGNKLFESFDSDSFAGDVLFGDGPVEMEGMEMDEFGESAEEMSDSVDRMVQELGDPRGGVAEGLNNVGSKIDENKEEAAASTALLSRVSGLLKKGAAGILIGGLALSLLQGIYGRVKQFARHSPYLESVTDMIDMAMSLFLRPIARAIGRWLLPLAMGMLNLAANFNRVWAEGGAFDAFRYLAGELFDALFSLPGLIAVSIAGIGTLLGYAIGSAVGAKAGAILGGTLGSFAGPVGTAVGVAVGGTLGAILGVLVAVNWDKIERYMRGTFEFLQNFEDTLFFLLSPVLAFNMWLYDKLKGWFKDDEDGEGGILPDFSIGDWLPDVSLSDILGIFNQITEDGLLDWVFGKLDYDIFDVLDFLFPQMNIDDVLSHLFSAAKTIGIDGVLSYIFSKIQGIDAFDVIDFLFPFADVDDLLRATFAFVKKADLLGFLFGRISKNLDVFDLIDFIFPAVNIDKLLRATFNIVKKGDLLRYLFNRVRNSLDAFDIIDFVFPTVNIDGLLRAAFNTATKSDIIEFVFPSNLKPMDLIKHSFPVVGALFLVNRVFDVVRPIKLIRSVFDSISAYDVLDFIFPQIEIAETLLDYIFGNVSISEGGLLDEINMPDLSGAFGDIQEAAGVAANALFNLGDGGDGDYGDGGDGDGDYGDGDYGDGDYGDGGDGGDGGESDDGTGFYGYGDAKDDVREGDIDTLQEKMDSIIERNEGIGDIEIGDDAVRFYAPDSEDPFKEIGIGGGDVGGGGDQRDSGLLGGMFQDLLSGFRSSLDSVKARLIDYGGTNDVIKNILLAMQDGELDIYDKMMASRSEFADRPIFHLKESLKRGGGIDLSEGLNFLEGMGADPKDINEGLLDTLMSGTDTLEGVSGDVSPFELSAEQWQNMSNYMFGMNNIGNFPFLDSSGEFDPSVIAGFASGGIVKDTMLGMVGEGTESEVVAPLSRLESIINTQQGVSGVNVSIEESGSMSDQQLARAVEEGVRNADADVDDSSIEQLLDRIVREISNLSDEVELDVEFSDKSKWEVNR